MVQINIFKNFIERVVGSSCEVRSPPKDCAAERSVEGGDEKKKFFICMMTYWSIVKTTKRNTHSKKRRAIVEEVHVRSELLPLTAAVRMS